MEKKMQQQARFPNGLECQKFALGELMPYFIHLSKKGIAPEVVSVFGSEALLRRATGSRLDKLLRSESNEALESIYAMLGTQMAYMKKIKINHGDLAPCNVIVENRRPVIIDWQQMWHDQSNVIRNAPDHMLLSGSTYELLESIGRMELYPYLMSACANAHNSEYHNGQRTHDAAIFEKALEEFGERNFIRFTAFRIT